MQFGVLRNMRLDKHGAALGIQSGCEPVEQHFNGILLYTRSVGVIGGQGMPIRDEEVAFVLILHAHPIIEGADKVAEVQFAGGAHATENALAMMGRRRHQMLIKMEM